MKHLFNFLVLTCLCMAKGWAVDVSPVTPERFDVSPLLTPRQLNESDRAVAKTASLKASTLSDVCGDYQTSCENMLVGGNDKIDITIKVADEASRKIAIKGFPLDCPIYGTVDETGYKLTIPNRQFLRMVGNDSVFFYFKELNKDWTPKDGVAPVPSVSGYISSDVIIFDAETIWAIGIPDDEKAGYFFMAYSMLFNKYIENWKPIGKATIQDGWILPAFGIDQYDRANWYEVEMEQDANRPTRYRLVNPYHGECPIVDRNDDTRGGYIQFNVKDPEHVVFDVVPAGFSSSALGVENVICYNILTAFSLQDDVSLSQLITNLGNEVPFTTYKDGVLTLSSKYSVQMRKMMQDACFAVQSDPSRHLEWSTADGISANMYTRIFFPGTALPDPNEGWKSYGTATFQDGWILPVYGIDQTKPENWYEVPVQVKADNPNIYRLVDPYHLKDCPVAQYNQSTKIGYIQFDVTDPEHVIFDIVSCGMAEPALQMTTMYLYNTLTSYVNNMGLSAEEIIDAIGESIPYSTFKDGVLNMTGFIDDPTEGIQYDCCVGSQLNVNASQRWRIKGGAMANMSTVITIKDNSAIETVGYDNSDAPVEYFNLQGIRVNQPAAGQIVIRRQGTEVSKMIVR